MITMIYVFCWVIRISYLIFKKVLLCVGPFIYLNTDMTFAGNFFRMYDHRGTIRTYQQAHHDQLGKYLKIFIFFYNLRAL